MVYCGATASLCALEVLAHSAMLPTDMTVVQARIRAAFQYSLLTNQIYLRIGAAQYLPRKRKTSERIG